MLAACDRCAPLMASCSRSGTYQRTRFSAASSVAMRRSRSSSWPMYSCPAMRLAAPASKTLHPCSMQRAASSRKNALLPVRIADCENRARRYVMNAGIGDRDLIADGFVLDEQLLIEIRFPKPPERLQEWPIERRRAPARELLEHLGRARMLNVPQHRLGAFDILRLQRPQRVAEADLVPNFEA